MKFKFFLILTSLATSYSLKAMESLVEDKFSGAINNVFIKQAKLPETNQDKEFDLLSSIAPSFLKMGMPNLVGAPAPDDTNTEVDNSKMGVKEPMSITTKPNMPSETYQACSTLMSLSRSIVQHKILESASKYGISPSDAITNMDAWIAGFANFPFCFFNFESKESNRYEETKFKLDIHGEGLIDKVLNIKGVPDLKDAVLAILSQNGGKIAEYKSNKQDFHYFGILNFYNEPDSVATRVVRFSLNLGETNTEVLCLKSDYTALKTESETHKFNGNAVLMKKLYDLVGEEIIKDYAEKLKVYMKEQDAAKQTKMMDDLNNIFAKVKAHNDAVKSNNDLPNPNK